MLSHLDRTCNRFRHEVARDNGWAALLGRADCCRHPHDVPLLVRLFVCALTISIRWFSLCHAIAR